jgi:hypothetical protein
MKKGLEGRFSLVHIAACRFCRINRDTREQLSGGGRLGGRHHSIHCDFELAIFMAEIAIPAPRSP